LGCQYLLGSPACSFFYDWNKIISLEQIIKKNIAAKINFFSVDSDLNLKNEKMFLLEQIVPLDKNEKIFY